MTLHRALSELKLIDAKIEKKIEGLEPVGLFQKGKLVGGIIKQDTFEQNAKSEYQSIADHLQRKTLIKKAIVDANAKTTLEINSKKMTIADAITYKDIIELRKKITEKLRKAYRVYSGELNKKNELVFDNARKLLEAALGKDNAKGIDVKDNDFVKTYIDANEFHLCDPISIDHEIKLLETEIAEFESEVDSALSEINAITFIEI